MSGRMPAQNETRVSKLCDGIRDLFSGRSNAVGELTLTPSQTSTVVQAKNCGPGSRVTLTPRTANAAAALATTYIPEATTIEGQFTVHHASAVSTDREFGYAIQG